MQAATDLQFVLLFENFSIFFAIGCCDQFSFDQLYKTIDAVTGKIIVEVMNIFQSNEEFKFNIKSYKKKGLKKNKYIHGDVLTYVVTSFSFKSNEPRK